MAHGMTRPSPACASCGRQRTPGVGMASRRLLHCGSSHCCCASWVGRSVTKRERGSSSHGPFGSFPDGWTRRPTPGRSRTNPRHGAASPLLSILKRSRPSGGCSNTRHSFGLSAIRRSLRRGMCSTAFWLSCGERGSRRDRQAGFGTRILLVNRGGAVERGELPKLASRTMAHRRAASQRQVDRSEERMTRRAIAATLRRYRAEWQAALARRDYATTRTILNAAASAVSKEASAALEAETRALHELLALDRRLEDIAKRAVPARLPTASHAFATSATRRFRGPWDRAMEAALHVSALKVVRRAIEALSREMAKQARSQQVLIARLRRLQRTPLEFSPVPARCALCGGTTQPGIDSGRLFVCTECVQQAHNILADVSRHEGARLRNRRRS